MKTKKMVSLGMLTTLFCVATPIAVVTSCGKKEVKVDKVFDFSKLSDSKDKKKYDQIETIDKFTNTFYDYKTHEFTRDFSIKIIPPSKDKSLSELIVYFKKGKVGSLGNKKAGNSWVEMTDKMEKFLNIYQ